MTSVMFNVLVLTPVCFYCWRSWTMSPVVFFELTLFQQSEHICASVLLLISWSSLFCHGLYDARSFSRFRVKSACPIFRTGRNNALPR
ncbi:hypothetical protein OBBRIDRAFT_186156 [Obba rivulosa]|uniref:Uncharacterized protein n=1 Tax=Obba rivulosa TaxID=1052685 RepID=A0A8E2AUN6_9APHY|nr:hypothetical protein OBBRIDRAFT_186156 [Obba rivulosa]